MDRRIHVYGLAPVDFWGGWSKPEDVLTDDPHDWQGIQRSDYEAFLERAKEIARRLGWEGDMRQGAFLAGIPDPDNSRSTFMLAWKQDNNGSTFVASPFPLPHLGRGSSG
jgi:hypothetical protein